MPSAQSNIAAGKSLFSNRTSIHSQWYIVFPALGSQRATPPTMLRGVGVLGLKYPYLSKESSLSSRMSSCFKFSVSSTQKFVPPPSPQPSYIHISVALSAANLQRNVTLLDPIVGWRGLVSVLVSAIVLNL